MVAQGNNSDVIQVMKVTKSMVGEFVKESRALIQPLESMDIPGDLTFHLPNAKTIQPYPTLGIKLGVSDLHCVLIYLSELLPPLKRIADLEEL